MMSALWWDSVWLCAILGMLMGGWLAYESASALAGIARPTQKTWLWAALGGALVLALSPNHEGRSLALGVLALGAVLGGSWGGLFWARQQAPKRALSSLRGAFIGALWLIAAGALEATRVAGGLAGAERLDALREAWGLSGALGLMAWGSVLRGLHRPESIAPKDDQ